MQLTAGISDKRNGAMMLGKRRRSSHLSSDSRNADNTSREESGRRAAFEEKMLAITAKILRENVSMRRELIRLAQKCDHQAAAI
jgi:hypothetical protein